MFLENLLVVVGAIIVIVLLWIIAGIKHFKYLKKELNDQWGLIDEALRKRYDLIPNLIETIRKFTTSEEVLIERIIQDRQKVVKEPSDSKGIERISVEYDFTNDINELIELKTKLPDLSKDTNYLELQKEIDDLEKNILVKTDKYNEMVRYYNKHREIGFLKPITAISRFGMETIFEVEK